MHPTLEEMTLAQQITDDILEQFRFMKKASHHQWQIKVRNVVQDRILKFNRQLEEKEERENGIG